MLDGEISLQMQGGQHRKKKKKAEGGKIPGGRYVEAIFLWVNCADPIGTK